ncbi:RluA family pseudouridine synthase [Leeuwenhoekiella aestuarii]|uniref:RluA family pseudouridine synthase n=1 Tax=Leeuwenhoekiella aestuarii TaxID=2249426 RepID=A0A4Q0NUM5_9FLAO|nr:RluA family pseudouridine synthase [Leeuwenhoekiella aestuarii]
MGIFVGALAQVLDSSKTEAQVFTIETHTALPQETPIRLQEYGVGIFKSLATKSALKKVLKKKQITVDGSLASTATWITGGERIVLTRPEAETQQKKLVFPVQVLYEDDYLAVIHKPAGILVSGNRFKTIANALLQNLEYSPLKDKCKPQPVHRLDFATTGALLVGKTRSSIRLLNKRFENKEVTKTYYAVTIGNMPANGAINQPIDDKPATSLFQICETVASPRFDQLNLVELKPLTGRRHQLRKHLSGMGNPILGDRDYTPEALLLKGKGMYLHAYSLKFQHPFTNQDLLIKDELPEGFTKLFKDH